MTTFSTQTYLSSRRNEIINIYNEMKSHAFFSGISMKDFGTKIVRAFEINNIKSEKVADRRFFSLVYNIVDENTEIEVVRDRDAELRNKYNNTAYMALV